MKPFSRGLAAGVALIACVLLLLAAVPSQTDFDGTYFKTNALPISLVGTLTNWAKINTNAVVSKAGDTMTGTLIAPEVDAVTNAVGTQVITNQSGFTGYTTAALPTGVAVGYQTYCTDCLTPWGTGDRVEWDGSGWRTLRMRVTATTNPAAYIFSCVAGASYLATPLSEMGISPETSGAVWNFPRVATTGSGVISQSSFGNSDAVGSYINFSTSSSATSSPRAAGCTISEIAAGGFYACGATIFLSAACSGTETYWAQMGFDQTAGATMPTYGAYFLYDMYNVAGRVGPGSETNRWLCVTANNSAYTYADSGLTPSTSGVSADKLAVILTSTYAAFFTNGVLCASNTVNVPIVRTSANVTKIVKTVGNTGRSLLESNPWYHVRHAAARSY